MHRLIALLTLALWVFATSAQEESVDINIGKKLVLHSEVLNEDRPYWVYLPASYNDGALQSYPVLYLLDGDAYFHSASGIVQFMSSGTNFNLQIPELIIVAIPSLNRERDLAPTHRQVVESSGGGDNFLKFMGDELFRKVDSVYRTMPYRILVGHSFGGLLALHALLDLPEKFQAYIAIDPSLWWDEQTLVHRAERELTEARGIRGTVYLAHANYADTGDIDLLKHTDAIRTFGRTLKSVASPIFRSTVQFFEEEDHGSVPLVALYHGLLFIFEGYKPPSIDLFIKQPSAVSAHFELISDRLGLELLPPLRLVNQFGDMALNQDGDKAIEFFKLNIRNFPHGWRAYDGLGRAYMARDARALAVENFQKSLELNPGNRDVAKRLQEARFPLDQTQ